MAAMKGTGRRSMAVIASSHATNWASGIAPAARALRSTPVQKARPVPAITTARRSGRAAIAATAAPSSATQRGSPALRTSGRFRAIRATGPSSVRSTAEAGIAGGAYVAPDRAVKARRRRWPLPAAACYPLRVATPYAPEEDRGMLSREDNELLTRTGPGTPMGDLVRRYWIPVVESKELAPGGRVKRVQLLGERLIAFRGKSGRAGLIGEFCPHRSASLFYGRVEDAGMRCAYHGWKFGLDGQCEEMPSEPPESSFASRVKQTAYPCAEAGGVIFAYMGPESTPPPLPELEWTLLPDGHTFASRRVQDCNWFQALEGGIDSSHISFLHAPIDHRNLEVTQDMDRVSFGVGAAVSTGDRAPRFEVVDTDYGVLIGARRANPDGRWYWRVTQFLLPFYTMPPTDLDE